MKKNIIYSLHLKFQVLSTEFKILSNFKFCHDIYTKSRKFEHIKTHMKIKQNPYDIITECQ